MTNSTMPARKPDFDRSRSHMPRSQADESLEFVSYEGTQAEVLWRRCLAMKAAAYPLARITPAGACHTPR
jgi:hypothetical protein